MTVEWIKSSSNGDLVLVDIEKIIFTKETLSARGAMSRSSVTNILRQHRSMRSMANEKSFRLINSQKKHTRNKMLYKKS